MQSLTVDAVGKESGGGGGEMLWRSDLCMPGLKYVYFYATFGIISVIFSRD